MALSDSQLFTNAITAPLMLWLHRRENGLIYKFLGYFILLLINLICYFFLFLFLYLFHSLSKLAYIYTEKQTIKILSCQHLRALQLLILSVSLHHFHNLPEMIIFWFYAFDLGCDWFLCRTLQFLCWGSCRSSHLLIYLAWVLGCIDMSLQEK